MKFWSRLFSDDFTEEGFVQRIRGDFRPEANFFPVAIYIGDFLWEHKFMVWLYSDGVALGKKSSDFEWFIPYSKILYVNESQRPFQVSTAGGKTKKISFGGDLVDKEVLMRWQKVKRSEEAQSACCAPNSLGSEYTD